MNCFQLIRSLRLTEKGTRQGDNYNQYTLVADRSATKLDIKRAVEEIFKVKVVKVNTLTVGGKLRRQGSAQAGRCADWKKAIVKLKQGDKIAMS